MGNFHAKLANYKNVSAVKTDLTNITPIVSSRQMSTEQLTIEHVFVIIKFGKTARQNSSQY
jgi:hypothetical protein